jgi:hypothetical protein
VYLPRDGENFHIHDGSDEVAYVLAGEITFKIGDEITVGGPGTSAFMPCDLPHAWKSTGAEPGRILFLYTPATAGKSWEEIVGRRPETLRKSPRITAGRWSGRRRSEPVQRFAAPGSFSVTPAGRVASARPT